MNTQTTTGLSVADRWNRYWYLQSVELWLDPMPRRRRREVLADLKRNLGEAAADVGMTAAISDLGRPRELARGYLAEEPRDRPTWGHGWLAATIVIVLWVFGTLLHTLGMLTVLEQSPTETAESGFLGLRVVAEYSDDAIGATFEGFAWPVAVMFLLVFVGFSRVWRLLPGAAGS